MSTQTQLWDTTAEWDAGSFSQTKSDTGSVILAKNYGTSTSQNEDFTTTIDDGGGNIDFSWSIEDASSGTVLGSGSETSSSDEDPRSVTTTIDVHAHPDIYFYVSITANDLSAEGCSIEITDFNNTTQVSASVATKGNTASDSATVDYSEELPTYSSGSHTTELRDYGTSDVTVNRAVVTTTQVEADDDTTFTITNQAGTSTSALAAGNGTTTLDFSLAADDQFQVTSDLSTTAEETASPSVDSIELIAHAAPSGLTVDAVRGTEIDISWTGVANGSGIEVLLAEASGTSAADYTVDHTTAAGATSTTITGLENGEKYYIRVRATYSTGKSDISAEVSTTTPLPATTFDAITTTDADNIVLEFTPGDNSPDGSIEIYRSDSSGSLGSLIATIGDDSTSYTDTGADTSVTQYYTLRRVTDHASTDSAQWSTLLPPPGVTWTRNADGTLTASWNDAATTEDGYRVEVSDDGGSTWTTVADLAANTTEYTLTGVNIDPTRGASWVVAIEAYRGSVTARESKALVPPFGTTSQTRTGSGWYVEIDHPSSGRTVSPTIVGEPQRNPQVNGLPRVRVPVPKSDKWSDDVWQGASMRVWHDGDRQPIDTMIRPEQQPGQTVLVGRGGEELLKRIQTDVVEREAHLEAQDLINTTSYAANVDAPATTAETDVLVQSGDTQSELSNNLASAFAASDPAKVTSSGTIDTLQTLFLFEAENFDNGGANDTKIETSSDRWSNYRVIQYTQGGTNLYAEFYFTPQHDIPASRVQPALRAAIDGNGHPGFQIELDYPDGTTEVALDAPPDSLDGTNETVPEWSSLGSVSTGLTAGSQHTLRFNFDTDSTVSDPSIYLDLVAIYDSDYHGTLSTNVTDGVGDGPPLYPANIPVEFADAAPTKSVVGGHGTITIDNTDNEQSVAISNDSGATWTVANNATEVRKDWTTTEDTIRLRVTLSRYASDTSTTPSQGDTGQSLDAYQLEADLQDTPILVNKSYDGRIVDILRSIAEYGNFVFEVRRGEDGYSVEWTQPGQRPTTVDADLLDYNVAKDSSSIVEKAVVFGVARDQQNESFTANHGTEVALAKSPVVESSEVVYDPSNGTVYDRGADYVMRNNAGTIETLSTGSMTDGSSYEIDYRYKISDSYTASGVSSPREQRFDLTEVPTQRGCGQAALYLVQKLETPVIEAELIVPKQPIGWNVINAINPDVLPVDEELQIRDVEQTPQQAVISLASRDSIGEIVQRLEDRVGAVSRRV